MIVKSDLSIDRMTTATLTHALAIKHGHASSLDGIKNLNIYGGDLEDVSLVSQMPNLETVSLSGNKIKSLKPFSKCQNLREILIRRNQISSLEDLYNLSSLPNLSVLWLSDNPIVQEPNYRQFAIVVLPHLTKLDQTEITQAERDEANKAIPDPEKIVPKQGKSSQKTVPPQSGRKSSRDLITTVTDPTQRHVLAAISNLILELDQDSLDVLSDQVNQLIKQK